VEAILNYLREMSFCQIKIRFKSATHQIFTVNISGQLGGRIEPCAPLPHYMLTGKIEALGALAPTKFWIAYRN